MNNFGFYLNFKMCTSGLKSTIRVKYIQTYLFNCKQICFDKTPSLNIGTANKSTYIKYNTLHIVNYINTFYELLITIYSQ